MHQQIILVLVAIIVLILLNKVYTSSERFYSRRRGMLMEEACASGDCTSEEGIKTAVAKCKLDRSKQLDPLVDKRCVQVDNDSNMDPRIKENVCPEPCDVESVPEHLRKQVRPICVTPLTLGTSKDGKVWCRGTNQSYLPYIDPATGKQMVRKPECASPVQLQSTKDGKVWCLATDKSYIPYTNPKTGIQYMKEDLEAEQKVKDIYKTTNGVPPQTSTPSTTAAQVAEAASTDNSKCLKDDQGKMVLTTINGKRFCASWIPYSG